jgi:hypothetical protein
MQELTPLKLEIEFCTTPPNFSQRWLAGILRFSFTVQNVRRNFCKNNENGLIFAITPVKFPYMFSFEFWYKHRYPPNLGTGGWGWGGWAGLRNSKLLILICEPHRYRMCLLRIRSFAAGTCGVTRPPVNGQVTCKVYAFDLWVTTNNIILMYLTRNIVGFKSDIPCCAAGNICMITHYIVREFCA